jgi:transposase InsO family protein
LKNKSGLKGKIKTLLTDLKIAGIDVKYIRCNGASENKTMKDDSEIKPSGIKFQLSRPRTPQRNGKVERKFQTFYGKIH